MFQDIHVPVLGVIENMSYFIAPDTLKRYDILAKMVHNSSAILMAFPY